MKAVFSGWTVAACLVLAAMAAPADDRPGASPRGPRIIRVGVLNDNDPYSYADSTGHIRGFTVDLLAAIERTMGLHLERVVGSTAEINPAFESGRLDLLQSYAPSETRMVTTDFSRPYSVMAGSIFVRRSEHGIKTLADLRGRRVMVHRNSLGERILREAGLGGSVVYVDSVEDGFGRLEAGENDATLAGRLTGLVAVERLGLENVVPVGEPVPGYEVNYCFAVQKGDVELLGLINEGLATLERTGEFDEIYDRWFGRFDPTRYTAFDILLGVAVGLFLALAVALWALVRQRRLQARIARQAATLRAQEEQLRQAQKLEAIGTLASGIAHDFNNILTSLVGNAELAAMDIAADHPARESLDEIRQASERARQLVRQILSFSRHAESHKRVLDPAPIVKETLRFIGATSPSTVEIRNRVAARPACIEVDPTQLHQVLMNLFTNAVHAMRERGGVLEVVEERLPVHEDNRGGHPASLAPGDYVRIQIRDTGEGMTPGVLHRAFEPFFTTKAPGEGTGLGLSVVHGIVQSAGGAVSVQSAPGRGSVFSLYFPVAVEAASEAVAKIAPEVPRGCGQQVLLVDDEPAIVHAASGLLERLGYKVRAHTRVTDALIDFDGNRDRIAVVVTDLTMPLMSGLDLTARVRAIQPGIRVVLMSGFMSEREMARARELRVDEMIDKPLTQASLGLAVAACLRAREAEDDGTDGRFGKR